MIEEQIIAGCKAGNRKSQRAFYEFCYPILARVGYRYAKNDEDIQEIINESFMRLIRKIDRLQSLTMSVEAYVWRAGVNTAIDLFRKSKTYKSMIQIQAAMPEDWKEQEMTTNDLDNSLDARELLSYMRQLPEPTGTILNLYAIDGYSHKEIGEMLDIKETLSRWHLHKARKMMKELLNQHNKSIAYGK